MSHDVCHKSVAIAIFDVLCQFTEPPGSMSLKMAGTWVMGTLPLKGNSTQQAKGNVSKGNTKYTFFHVMADLPLTSGTELSPEEKLNSFG